MKFGVWSKSVCVWITAGFCTLLPRRCLRCGEKLELKTPLNPILNPSSASGGAPPSCWKQVKVLLKGSCCLPQLQPTEPWLIGIPAGKGHCSKRGSRGLITDPVYGLLPKNRSPAHYSHSSNPCTSSQERTEGTSSFIISNVSSPLSK